MVTAGASGAALVGAMALATAAEAGPEAVLTVPPVAAMAQVAV
jgi:hypothetical protein